VQNRYSGCGRHRKGSLRGRRVGSTGPCSAAQEAGAVRVPRVLRVTSPGGGGGGGLRLGPLLGATQIRPVPIKTVTQQAIGTLHRLRSGWMGDRTRAINALRGLLRELGFFIPEGRKHVLPEAWEIIQDHTRGLPEALKPSLSSLCEEILSLSTRIEEIEAQLDALARQIPLVARLRTVPGIGLLSATALYAFRSEPGFVD
jgi:hypothetical protein